MEEVQHQTSGSREKGRKSFIFQDTCSSCRKPFDVKEMKKLRRGLFCGICIIEARKRKRRAKKKVGRKKPPGDTSAGIKCDLCDRVFLLQTELRLHYETMHVGVKPFCCDICGNRFARKVEVQIHKSYKHSDGETGFLCILCSRMYKCKHAFNKHMKIHTATQVFECNECGKALKSRESLSKHKRLHTGEKPFQCDSCEERFMSGWAVKQHCMKMHGLPKPFLCDLCGSSYGDRRRLEEHRKVHFDILCYTCETCGTNLRSEYSLKLHRLTFHTAKSETYTCEVCNKTFGHLLILKRHERRHMQRRKAAKYMCNLCDFKCFSNGDLKKHFLSHTKEKKHMCNMCHKKFKYPFTLRRHFETFHANPNLDRPKRQASRWSPEDSQAVCNYFSSYIEDLTQSQSKGCLPTKQEVDMFLSLHAIFVDSDMDASQKYTVVRSKVFNERNKFRKENASGDSFME